MMVKEKVADILNKLDDSSRKIPETVMKSVQKTGLALLVVISLVSGYIGWTIGGSSIKPMGQAVAKDTKSLFIEDYERDYNRKRKDIQLKEPNSIKLNLFNEPKLEMDIYEREKYKDTIIKDFQSDKNYKEDSKKYVIDEDKNTIVYPPSSIERPLLLDHPTNDLNSNHSEQKVNQQTESFEKNPEKKSTTEPSGNNKKNQLLMP